MLGKVPEGRTKPWGTGQAVLAAKDLLHEPFAVINADDYYRKEAFRQLHDWLVLDHADSAIAMAGFIIRLFQLSGGWVSQDALSHLLSFAAFSCTDAAFKPSAKIYRNTSLSIGTTMNTGNVAGTLQSR